MMEQSMCPTVEAKNASFHYLHSAEGLEPINLKISSGEMVLISGPSGSGKSTLARCLTGLIPQLYHGAFSGKVWLGDLDTSQTPLWKLADHAGLVFQNPASQMLATSVEDEIIFGLENLGLPSEVVGSRLGASLSQFNLHHLLDRSPQKLSGGEQQQLALAAVSAREPQVLVLDEPLSMLDAGAATGLIEHAVQLCRMGTTIIFCEHRIEYFDTVPNLRRIRLGDQSSHPAVPSIHAYPSHSSSPHNVQIDRLRVEIDGGVIIEDLNLSVEGGEIVAVVGRNGVGKTTFLRALADLQRYEGRVRIGSNGRKPDLGLVFQNPDLQLFNPTVRDEILYRIPKPDLDFYHWLLETLGLSRYEKKAPLLLSEGEKKRLALASVLMRGPSDGILLDEPALGQDHNHKTMLIRLLRALADTGRVVMMATHDLSLAVQADRLILLGPDGIAAEGQPSELLRQDTHWHEVGLPLPNWVREMHR